MENLDQDKELNIAADLAEPDDFLDFAEISTEESLAAGLHEATSSPADTRLEQALKTMPRLRAPGHTLSRMLARIATLPQLDLDAAAISIGLVPPRQIKYVPPVISPEYQDEAEASHNRARLVTNNGQFNPLGYVFVGLWISLCLVALYLVWPALLNLMGITQDPEGQGRLATIQNWWNNVSSSFTGLFNTVQPYLPTIVSAIAGIVIMVYVIGSQQRRLWNS
jgi:hypothetical protein